MDCSIATIRRLLDLYVLQVSRAPHCFHQTGFFKCDFVLLCLNLHHDFNTKLNLMQELSFEDFFLSTSVIISYCLMNSWPYLIINFSNNRICWKIFTFCFNFILSHQCGSKAIHRPQKGHSKIEFAERTLKANNIYVQGMKYCSVRKLVSAC